MILSKKVRLKPTPEQESKLWQSVGTARFIYNWTLARQEENYKHGGKFISDNDLRKEITILKKSELNWLNEVSNNVAKQAVKDGCDAYKKYFKKQSKKPKFKSKRKSKPSFYNDTHKLKVKENLVLIEKVGWVVTSEQIPMDKKYTNPRISFDGKYWYLSVGIETEIMKPALTGETLGIDVGIKVLAKCSNEITIPNINKTKTVKKLEERLRRLQRKLSNKYEKGKEGENRYVKTSNIVKLEEEIRRLHRRLSNIKNNHLHQATTLIVKTKPSKVVMETLNIKGMMKNRHLSKAIAKQKLYQFKQQMKYKCEIYGIEFVEADRFYPSSKLCSGCGHKKASLNLSERVYTCEECGAVLDRDYNAAVNLSRYSAQLQ